MNSDFVRGILLGIVCILAYLLWNGWQKDHPALVPAPSTISASHNGTLTTLPGSVNATTTSLAPPQLIHVKTDVLAVDIDPVGGAIVHSALLEYPQALHDPQAYVLMNTQPHLLYTAQSGLVSGTDAPIVYQSPQQNYTLATGQDELVIPLTWRNKDGLLMTKTLTFGRGSYRVKLAMDLQNASTKPWQGNFYLQLKRIEPVQASAGFFNIKPFLGAVISSPDKRYQKFTFSELAKEPVNQTISNGWAAMEEHYFISAWIPDANQSFNYSSQSPNATTALVNLVSNTLTVAPGQNWHTSAQLYTGPAIASILKPLAPGLDLTIDYGFLWFISGFLFWLMQHIYNFVGNWGVAIILVTVAIKLCFYKLSAISFRSMAAMRALQPQIVALKERFGDDRQKLGQATMELYKKEKVNPMGGCLPMIVQIPVFIALYWVLVESVQLRLAPFVLWIHDLAAPDPYYVLPILMGASMFIQQKLSPPPPDPMQAKMMMMLPIVFTVFFLNFPAGLVIYWVINNSLSIVQQLFITKRYEREQLKRTKAKK